MTLRQLVEDKVAIPSPVGSITKQRSMWMMHSWLYRCKLIVGTVIISWLLFAVQGRLNDVTSHLSLWQSMTQWAETLWIIPVPTAVLYWCGWLLFAQAVHLDPAAIDVPYVPIDRTLVTSPLLKPIRLVFRFVTRGDNVDVLRESVLAVHEAFAHYTLTSGPYRIEIVSECPIDIAMVAKDNTSVHVVPKDYVTANQSRFKARALTYLQEQTSPQQEDWHIYLDEESKVDEVFIAGVYHFISQSETRMSQPKRHLQGIIGQGTIIYRGGHWFFRGADAIRTADDLGRFRLQYSLGIPIFGMHGSFIVVRGIDETRLTFDVGPQNSIAEDTAWALRAWAKGFRFAWINGYLYEQPPQRVKDFVKQRSRWLIGVRLVLSDKALQLRYKLCLTIFTYFWHFSPILPAILIIAFFTRTPAFVWVQIPANVVWVVFFLSYLQGTEMQALRSEQLFSRGKRTVFQILKMRVLAYPLVICIFLYTFLEGFSILYACICPNQGFFVIRKPNLNTQTGYTSTTAPLKTR